MSADPTQIRAVEMLKRGDSSRQVRSTLGVTEEWLADAVKTVRNNGATALSTARPTPPPPEPTRDALGLMLSRADESTSKAAQRTAEKIRALIATLREQLQQSEDDDRKAAAVAAERERVQAEVAAARRALDEASAKLRELTGKPVKASKPTAPRGEWVENADGTWTSPAGRRYAAADKAAMVDRMKHAQASRHSTP